MFQLVVDLIWFSARRRCTSSLQPRFNQTLLPAHRAVRIPVDRPPCCLLILGPQALMKFIKEYQVEDTCWPWEKKRIDHHGKRQRSLRDVVFLSVMRWACAPL